MEICSIYLYIYRAYFTVGVCLSIYGSDPNKTNILMVNKKRNLGFEPRTRTLSGQGSHLRTEKGWTARCAGPGGTEQQGKEFPAGKRHGIFGLKQESHTEVWV